MKVIGALKKEGLSLSFEFFPPKTEKQEANLFEAIEELKKFNPDFASVTCGAMGANREKTIFWVKKIKEKYDIEPVAHITCVAETKDGMKKYLDELSSNGIENVLALRGDPPAGESKFTPPINGFSCAKELVSFIKTNNPNLCVGVAGYPEGHRESPNLGYDIQYLKEKIDAGAEYIVTQLFFDTEYFFDFKERCLAAGINVPILPGIMQITSLKSVEKMVEICGATIPRDLLVKLEKYGNDPQEIEKIGVDAAVGLCEKLIKSKVPGLHFFVLNQSAPISKVLKQIKLN